MLWIHRTRYYYVLALCTIAAFLVMYVQWMKAEQEIEHLNTAVVTGKPITLGEKIQVRAKPPKQTVKGLYLTAYSAGNPVKLNEIIKLIDQTELNAVVIDVKDYSGLVLFDTKNKIANNLHLKDNRYRDLAATIQKLHSHGIYVIARQTVFQDPALAAASPQWALQDKRGGLWRDHKGLAWVDATRQEVWRYNLALAEELSEYGFDEINLDYVRFPSDGDMSQVVYQNGAKKKYETMGSFFNFMSKNLADEPVWLSLDMFGFVMERKGEDDMKIGQRLADAVGNADYICPMMYPSHYPPGHLGLKNPADFPGLVFENGLTLGMPWFKGARAEARPWLQAFNIGAVYDATKIREQIDAVEKHTSAGWLLWNASNRYTNAGLKSE